MSTDAQADALKRAHDILCEFFPAHLIITRRDDEVGSRFQEVEITFDGGFYNALGMVSYAQQQLPIMFADDEDEDDDEVDA